MKHAFLLVLLFVVTSAPVLAQPVSSFRSGEIQAYDNYGRPNPDAFEWTGLSLGGNIGTLGFGGDVTYHLVDWANIRGSLHLFSLTYKDTLEGVDTTFDFDFNGLILTIDFYPGLMRSFRLSAGAGLNSHDVDISGASLEASAEYDTFAPYLGIGWGNPVQPDSALTFTFDLGVLIQDYSVSFDGNVPAGLQSDVKDILDLATIYPVMTFGLHYHF